MTSKSFTVPSFAKVNLRLQILGKRPDGYHELRTILQTISLHDTLHFKTVEARTISLECSDPELPTDERNLVVRAALALKQRYGIDDGAKIQLEKRIPTRAGLGGGSSNAATALVALSHLWNINVDKQTLVEMATRLGTDVPFFLIGGRALGEGTGATLSPLSDCDRQQLVVLTPNAGVSSADAYAAMNSPALTTPKTDSILSSSPAGQNFCDSKQSPVFEDLSNDFESVIFDMEPEIRRSKEALLDAGARYALLAGSGSSVFAVFEDKRSRELALGKIQMEPGWRAFPCDTLSRNEYERALSVDDISLLSFFKSDSDIGA